jgi:MarR family transcriptional regulator, organic hydroperoxide resistance regulator
MNDKSVKISNIIDNLRRIFQILNEQSKKVENETGLTSPQLWAIKVINEHSPIKVSDLAGRLYLHPATVVGIIDRLEIHKLVQRRRCQDDRRVVWIELTPRGNALVKSAPEVAQGLLVAGLEGLSSNNIDGIDRSMRQFVRIFGAQKIPPKLIMSSEVNLPRKKTESLKER